MIPRSIEADRGAGTLHIIWEDAHESLYSLPDLRWACPCAMCRGEWGQPGLLATLTSLPPDELQLEDLQLVGSYAIAPTWKSGHSTGLYTFEYLRSLCPCVLCKAATSEDAGT
jgi:DUF971 family protein